MKLKLLFCLMDFKVGGIAKVQCDLANALCSDYEVHVLPFNKNGVYLSRLDQRVTVLNPSLGLRLLACSQQDAKRIGFFPGLLRAALAIFARIFTNRLPRKLCMLGMKLKGYDIAISYAQDGPLNYIYGGAPEFVLRHVKAKKKIQFIHDDLRREEYRSKRHIKLYRQFDQIVTLSKDGASRIQPLLGNKEIVSIPNYVDPAPIIELSKEPCDDLQVKDGACVFLTCARLSPEKGLLRCIEAFSRIEQNNYLWVILGMGSLEKEIRDSIASHGLGQHIRLLGSRDNPYPYFLKANYYLMCSLNEAFPAVIDEAHALNIPVVATTYGAAKEQLLASDIICPNDLDGLTDALKQAVATASRQRPESLERLTIRNNESLIQLELLFKR